MQHSSPRQPWIALTTLTLLTGLLGALGCEPPVSDEATLTITGRVLNADGTPAANQKVDLYKSDLPLFESDTLIGYSIAVGTPFQTAQTDADGNYRIVLSGAEANTSSQKFAAYFGVSVTQGSDRQLAVASYSFQFSNQDLSEALPEMRFWDSGAVAVEGEELTFTWDAPPTPTRSGEVHVALPGVWLDAVEGGRYRLSTLALPFEGEAQGFELIAVSDQLRYRTSLKPFTASNPRGAGLDYSQPLNNNISGTDCEGKNLFDLNDGIFAGDSGVELFGQSTREGARCVVLTLPAEASLSDIVIRNGLISQLSEATVDIQVRPEGGDWTTLRTIDGPQTDFGTLYVHLSGEPVQAKEVRLQINGAGGARFEWLGEVTLYAAE